MLFYSTDSSSRLIMQFFLLTGLVVKRSLGYEMRPSYDFPLVTPLGWRWPVEGEAAVRTIGREGLTRVRSMVTRCVTAAEEKESGTIGALMARTGS